MTRARPERIIRRVLTAGQTDHTEVHLWPKTSVAHWQITRDCTAWTAVVLTLVQRLRRWLNVKPTAVRRLTFRGASSPVFFPHTSPCTDPRCDQSTRKCRAFWSVHGMIDAFRRQWSLQPPVDGQLSSSEKYFRPRHKSSQKTANVSLMLGQGRRSWPNIRSALG